MEVQHQNLIIRKQRSLWTNKDRKMNLEKIFWARSLQTLCLNFASYIYIYKIKIKKSVMFKIVLNLTVTKIYMMNSIGNYTSLKKKKNRKSSSV